MQIELVNIGKQFNTDWVFRNICFSVDENSVTAILGRNGSGKSTLLQIIAGNISPTTGKVTCTHGSTSIPDDAIFRHLALVAPYQELIEEFTLGEMLDFHFSFKPIMKGFDRVQLVEMLGFNTGKQKQIRQFSSGMKQRVKLILALLSDVPLLLLDEPAMNLDEAGIEWYHNMIGEFKRNRTVIICSNLHQTESFFADKIIRIEKYN